MGRDERHDLESAFDMDFEEGLPPSVDRAAVRRMRFIARVLDDSIPIPGTTRRIGIDPLIGVVPGAGDAVSAVLSLYIVIESARLGVSYQTLIKMLANVSVDVAGGIVPYVGGLFDAAWKANERNVDLALDDLSSGSDQSSDVTHIEIE